MSPQLELLAAAVYLGLGRFILSRRAPWRDVAFALLNLAMVWLVYFWARDQRFRLLFSLLFLVYLAIVGFEYLALRWWSRGSGWLPWLAFIIPVGVLGIIRYTPVAQISTLFEPVHRVLQRHPEFTLSWVFVGSSYLAFRTSYLVLEVRNGVVARPGWWRYLGFAFFAPTLSVGPINPYSEYSKAFTDASSADASLPEIPADLAALRVLTGAVKYQFLGPLLNQLTYSGLLLDGHPHLWIDLPIAAIAYYLFLYCNFSGFCDIAVGGAGLMGIPVAENFDNPFAARDMKDFWNRWHITLSRYMRDVVFSPLSKNLVRWLGPARANHAIALTILVVFLLVGVWHGAGWNYAAFGAAHGLGLIAVHYYDIALKKRLGKNGYKKYHRNRFVHAAAVVVTFVYVSATLFLFANDWTAMRTIFAALRRYAR